MAVSDGRGGASVMADGGVTGWIAVLTLFTLNMSGIGVTKGFGVLLLTLQDQLASATWILGWIAAMAIATSGISALFSGILKRRFGVGVVVTVCVTKIGVGLIGGSFATTTLQLALFYVLAGLGIGVSNVLAKEAVGRTFNENYATAFGIAKSGTFVGLLVMPPLTQFFLDTYGWRGTLLLLGGLCFNTVAPGAFLATSPQAALHVSEEAGYRRLSDQTGPISSMPRTNFGHFCCTSREILLKDFSLELLIDARFWDLTVVKSSTKFAYGMWVIYFVSAAQSNGFTATEAGWFVSFGGIGGLLAVIAQGPLNDRGVLSSWSLTTTTMVVCSASYCASPLLTSNWAMMTSTLLIGFCFGVVSVQVDVLIRQTFGVELMVGAFGWEKLLSGMFNFMLGFLPGLFYDILGSYVAGFMVVSVVQILPVTLLLHLWYSGKK
ncbi:monocarboxylate transporter 12-like [Acanthaster planci]|uniref:Monocarboxylate transporter 12-like n=1 Tax=Acanthaster planci TaxID=133434 RepID=A0A8B7YXL3_ACAPL|nr:monocarboxylate transporter 12-like [Acanthaster planci]